MIDSSTVSICIVDQNISEHKFERAGVGLLLWIQIWRTILLYWPTCTV